jgi:hypothetical protein
VAGEKAGEVEDQNGDGNKVEKREEHGLSFNSFF